VITGGSDLAEAGALPKKGCESLVLMADIAECQPFAEDYRPGKERKKHQQNKYYQRRAAGMGK